MIFSMDQVEKPGQMVPFTQEVIKMDTNTAQGSLNGQTIVHIQVNSAITISMEQVHISGAMVVNIVDNGATTRCMEQVNFHGLMGDSMKVSIQMTVKKAKVCFIGQMEKNMMGNGLMESSMVQDITYLEKEIVEKGSGKLVNV